MRGDYKSTMLPMAPVATMPPSTLPSKPKLDFSIESLVGRSDNVSESKKNRTARLTPPPAHSTKIDFYNGNKSLIQSPESELLLRRADFEYGARTNLLPQTAPVNAAGIGYPSMFPPYHENSIPATLYSQQQQYSPYLFAREYQSYPWLVARQPRLFPYRSQGPQNASFILHQFRKPKRIRTAFSPSQLLTLEHAFEKNHYVVGAERKQLAQDLNLTETQVKVWFQNRRTKHKRQKQEEEQQGQNSSDTINSEDKEHHQSSPSESKDDSDQSDCDSRDSYDVSQRSSS